MERLKAPWMPLGAFSFSEPSNPALAINSEWLGVIQRFNGRSFNRLRFDNLYRPCVDYFHPRFKRLLHSHGKVFCCRHRRGIFPRPLSVEDALLVIERWLGHPRARVAI